MCEKVIPGRTLAGIFPFHVVVPTKNADTNPNTADTTDTTNKKENIGTHRNAGENYREYIQYSTHRPSPLTSAMQHAVTLGGQGTDHNGCIVGVYDSYALKLLSHL